MRLGETPVHIPNTMVKTKAADDTILVTVWESRWLPDQKKNNWFYQWSEDSKSWGFWWLINIQSDCTLKTSYRDKYWEKYLWKQIFQSRHPRNKTKLWTTTKFFKLLMMQRYASKRLSKEERRVDALALRAEERRDKLRKAAGRSKYPLIRRCLNGETRMSNPHASIRQSITYGREPPELKHLSRARKRKKIYRFPK